MLYGASCTVLLLMIVGRSWSSFSVCGCMCVWKGGGTNLALLLEEPKKPTTDRDRGPQNFLML